MILYLKNYKGFEEAIVPIKDVNFLVGENSSGKTAFLNILELISSPSFWFNMDFNNDEIELGYFSEIVSQTSGNQKSFCLGICFNDEKQNNSCIWIKFKEQKGSPIIDEFKFIVENKSIWCKKINEKKVKYFIKQVADEFNFEIWVKDFDYPLDGSGVYGEVINISQFPFLFICNQIAQKINKDSNDSIENDSLDLFNHRFVWVAPIRAKAKRWYDSYNRSYSPVGEHIPTLLRKICDGKDKTSKKIIEMLNTFGQNSRLFDKINVNNPSKNTPFSIEIEYGALKVNMANVGYGVSQVLPLVINLLMFKRRTIAIQQPEVHLHAKAQAAFGELLYDATVMNRNRLLIETHSDFAINRFRYKLHFSSDKKKPGTQVLFFQHTEKGTTISTLSIDEEGHFASELPDEYSKFFIDEELKMLEF